MKEKGNTRKLARFISAIENRESAALKTLAKLYQRYQRLTTNDQRLILGITGPPGAGKSTLVDGIISRLRKNGRRVGVVAIDPSSPFSGGAILGDRIRMQAHAGDKGVFIRSVGSRGSHGGLSRATRDIVRAMAVFGMDDIIVETVGVGQTELDIMEIADVTVVILVPESGDMVQTMKAGLLEIADIFVVNKADRPGAEQMKNWLGGMFDSGMGLDAEAIKHHEKNMQACWCAGDSASTTPARLHACTPTREVPILLTQANKGIGIDELMNAIEMRVKAVHGDARQKTRKEEIRRQEFFDICTEEFKKKLAKRVDKDKKLEKLIEKNPYEAAKLIDKCVKFEK